MSRRISRLNFEGATAVSAAIAPIPLGAGPTDNPDTTAPAGSVNIMTVQYPAAFPGNVWREAIPCGNGKFGAAVYGSIQRERILFNH